MFIKIVIVRTFATKAENLKVILGVHNISDATEKHRKGIEVFRILVHGVWNPEKHEFCSRHCFAQTEI